MSEKVKIDIEEKVQDARRAEEARRRYAAKRNLDPGTLKPLPVKSARFPTYPPDILSRADAMLSEAYGDKDPIDPKIVELMCRMAVEERDDWRDMSLAPEDANIIVADAGGWVGEVYWYGHYSDYLGGGPGWMIANCDSEYGSLVEATRWRPIPEPPIAKAIRGTE